MSGLRMAIYEIRTYTLYVGKRSEATERYQQFYPVIVAEGWDKKLVGYFFSDAGTLNQLVHIWKFEDDADRRTFWKTVSANTDFSQFAAGFRPLVMKQKVKLLAPAPWGHHP